MPGFSTGALRLVMKGHIATVQTWSTSLWLQMEEIDPGPDNTDLDAIMGIVKPLIDTWAGSVKTGWYPNTQYDGLTGYFYSPDTTHAVIQSSPAVTPIVGSSTAGPLPAFTSLVHSMRTARTGRSYRGRMYLPLTNSALSASLQVVPATALAYATATATLCTALNGMSLSSHQVSSQTCCVASFTKGEMTPITSVQVDTLPDTQHRRDDKTLPVAVEPYPVTGY